MNTLIIDKKKLPANKSQKEEFLNQYFSGLLVEACDVDNQVSVSLSWPNNITYFVDPDLQKGLSWWNKDLKPENIHQQYQRSPLYQLSLTDNWSLYSWSLWLQSKNNQASTVDVIILHVDDHTDFMSPLLTKEGDIWADLITGNAFDINQPETVKAAVLSGAISVGSFIAPFFHGIRNITFRHLRNKYRTGIAESKTSLYPSLTYDQLLREGQLRPSISLKSFNSIGHRSVDYQVSDSATDWLSNLPKNIPVLLHIDMDYFNNRFDGDSDWQERVNKLDPTQDEISTQIRSLFSHLWQKVERSQVEDITVALSPGFFPAEYWQQSIELLHEQLIHE
ncbi:hypothetical protein [uncultured Fibrella sp.]|uniref:hypothetical protein n=1 Tax=uncultured Fibrella sp. TaxID=1284596 RepID=UPI0035CC8A23